MSNMDYDLDDSLNLLESLAQGSYRVDHVKGRRTFHKLMRDSYRFRRAMARIQVRERGLMVLRSRRGGAVVMPANVPFKSRIRNRLRSLTIGAFLAREATRARQAALVKELGGSCV